MGQIGEFANRFTDDQERLEYLQMAQRTRWFRCLGPMEAPIFSR